MVEQKEKYRFLYRGNAIAAAGQGQSGGVDQYFNFASISLPVIGGVSEVIYRQNPAADDSQPIHLGVQIADASSSVRGIQDGDAYLTTVSTRASVQDIGGFLNTKSPLTVSLHSITKTNAPNNEEMSIFISFNPQPDPWPTRFVGNPSPTDPDHQVELHIRNTPVVITFDQKLAAMGRMSEVVALRNHDPKFRQRCQSLYQSDTRKPTGGLISWVRERLGGQDSRDDMFLYHLVKNIQWRDKRGKLREFTEYPGNDIKRDEHRLVLPGTGILHFGEVAKNARSSRFVLLRFERVEKFPAPNPRADSAPDSGEAHLNAASSRLSNGTPESLILCEVESNGVSAGPII